MRRVGLCGVERKSGTLPVVQKQSDYWLWICRTLTLNLKDNLSSLQFIFTVAAKGTGQYAQSFMKKSGYKQTNSLTTYSKWLYSKDKLKVSELEITAQKEKKICAHINNLSQVCSVRDEPEGKFRISSNGCVAPHMLYFKEKGKTWEFVLKFITRLWRVFPNFCMLNEPFTNSKIKILHPELAYHSKG